jgi:HlyD family type I secretion membrane fusion protein
VLHRLNIRAPIPARSWACAFLQRAASSSPVPILDIVPEDDRLMIEARVSPLDIDPVKPGLPAQVRLTAFKQRTTPTLDEQVVQVSADSPSDEQAKTATTFYKTDIQIDPAELARLDGVSLYPGIPAEVLIRTGERTLADYLIAPVRDSFARAFREE